MPGIVAFAVYAHAAVRRFDMSDNYHLYAQKMAEQLAARRAASNLYRQLMELMQFVLQCEAAWVD